MLLTGFVVDSVLRAHSLPQKSQSQNTDAVNLWSQRSPAR